MSYSTPSHEPKHKISKGIFKDEKILLFATLLQDVTRSFLTSLRCIAEQKVEGLRISLSSKQGFGLLQQYVAGALDQISEWTDSVLRDEESRVLQVHPELPDLYSYAAIAMAQSFVKDVTTEVKLELPSFKSFLFVFYQTLSQQPYIRSLNYWNHWHLETAALLQDVVRYSLYSVVKSNLKYEGKGRSHSTLTARDIAQFKQDPVQALENLGLPDSDEQLESVSQSGTRYFDPDSRSHVSHASRASRVPEDRRSHVSHTSKASKASHTSKTSKASHASKTSHTSKASDATHATHATHASKSSRSEAERKSILQDARSILSRARSTRGSDSKLDKHEDGTRSMVSRRPADARSRVESVISLNLSEAQLLPLEEEELPPRPRPVRDHDSDSSSSGSGSDSDSDTSSRASRASRRSHTSHTSRVSAAPSYTSAASHLTSSTLDLGRAL